MVMNRMTSPWQIQIRENRDKRPVWFAPHAVGAIDSAHGWLLSGLFARRPIRGGQKMHALQWQEPALGLVDPLIVLDPKLEQAIQPDQR